MSKTKSPANLPIGSEPWIVASCRAHQCPLNPGMEKKERQRIIVNCATADGGDIGTVLEAEMAEECHRRNPWYQGQGTP